MDKKGNVIENYIANTKKEAASKEDKKEKARQKAAMTEKVNMLAKELEAACCTLLIICYFQQCTAHV